MPFACRQWHLTPSGPTGSPQLDYNKLCGQERLWSFERVMDSFLEGHDNKTFPNVDKRADCLRLCLAETDFLCRYVAAGRSS